jgi:hypothetical protein
MRVIERKTAVLFAAATELGGVLADLSAEACAALRRYGMQLGCAFQIADDLLDYVSDADTLGKNIGDDLAEGKPTLPLIYAIQRSTPMQAEPIRSAIPAHWNAPARARRCTRMRRSKHSRRCRNPNTATRWRGSRSTRSAARTDGRFERSEDRPALPAVGSDTADGVRRTCCRSLPFKGRAGVGMGFAAL